MYHETFSNSQIETNMNKVSEGKKLYYKSYLLKCPNIEFFLFCIFVV